MTILNQILTRILKQKSNSEWNRIFGGEADSNSPKKKTKRAKFPYGPVNNLQEVFKDPQIKFNEMEIQMEHENVGTIKQVKFTEKYIKNKNVVLIRIIPRSNYLYLIKNKYISGCTCSEIFYHRKPGTNSTSSIRIPHF